MSIGGGCGGKRGQHEEKMRISSIIIKRLQDNTYGTAQQKRKVTGLDHLRYCRGSRLEEDDDTIHMKRLA